jgi:hypothetical protein
MTHDGQRREQILHPAADHKIRPAMWPGLSPARLPPDLRAAMHLQIVEADRHLSLRYVANEPHCLAMWIGLIETTMPAEPTKELDVKRPGVRARGT